MENNKLVIEVNGSFYTLIPLPFEDNIDIAEYLKTDYSNIFGELITMPLVLNQIANLRAEIDSLVTQQKTGLEILAANLAKDFKSERQKTTVADVEQHVILNEQYQKEKDILINYQKQHAYLDSFYWSAQSKINALNKISDKISPEEFNIDILEKSINNVVIKKFQGRI